MNTPADLDRVLAAMGDEVVTASELANRVGVCERTIYRCVARLRRKGHRILSGAGIGYLVRPRRPAAGEARANG
ncbi:helix-turn-helix domain-containing protein [Aminobacter aminovorans]|uniref:DNA-binding transcriptional regulator YafY n=1 Tax=Aminobacter aminovorans TaxID=83263 RepID=A0AAC8YPF9_AMIAI|nr:helix-turn-helix domain-containing protein [Aminobacter aminovorans]AMS41226.1 hypothetical protein AA2016_2298 [Aminobacter aminovorans]MBB3705791.1 putative DNA-binding transcriptional regulator YafY [Aminobacter aminovorans]